MPFFVSNDDGGGGRPLARDFDPQRIAPSGLFGPAFRLENPIASAIAGAAGEFPEEPGYNPTNDPAFRGTDYERNHGDRFIGSRSAAETQSIISRIERELYDREALDAAGPLGLIAQMVAGTADPTILFPAGSIIRSVRGGVAVGRSAVSAGAAVGAQVAVQEAVLQGTQETRTLAESGIAIGTATLLGALLGGGVAATLGRAERRALESALDAERRAAAAHTAPAERAADNVVDLETARAGRQEAAGEADAEGVPESAPTTGSPLAASTGAAATDLRELSPVGYLFDKIPGWSRVAHLVGADLGIYSSASTAAKRAFSQIAETTLRFRQNLERTYKDPVTGETRTLPPEVTSPVVPLDREVKIHMHQTQIKVQDETRRLYSEYFFGQPDATLPYVRAEMAVRGLGPDAALAEGKMDPAAFAREVSTALQSGDRHAIPQVEQAAQFIRQHVLDPWAKRMEKANPNFKLQEFGEGESYFPFRYLNDKIIAQRPQFIDEVMVPWLIEDQAKKAAAKQRLEWSVAQLRSWEKQISKLEARFGRAEDRAARIESRAAERARDDRPQTVGMNEPAPEGRIADLQERRARIEAEMRDMREAIEFMEEMLPGQSAIPGILDRTAAQLDRREITARVEAARHSEAGRQGRLSERRLAALERQLADAEHKQILIEEYLVTAQRAHDEIRAKIEEEIAAWEGKSAAEAKAALKAREKADAARTPEQKDAKPRLESADDAIDRAVRRIIESDRDLSPQELREKASEITDHIIGTPIGRIPYDIAATANADRKARDFEARGPLLARDFAIPYARMKDYLDHDLDAVLGSWLRTMVPDTLLHERFPGEGPAIHSVHRQIQEEYDALARAAKSDKQRAKLNAEKDRVIKTIDGVLARIRGTANNTVGLSGRIGENVRMLNQMTDLGMAAVTSLPDLGGAVLFHGLNNVFRDGWLPLFNHLTGDDLAKMSKKELRAMTIGIEMETSGRGHALAELSDAFAPRTRAERMLKAASNRYFTLNLQAPETDIAKRIAGRTAMSSILDAIEAETLGKATKKQITALRESNISADLSRRIWNQFSAPDGGANISGTKLSNVDNWTDEAAKMHFMAAVNRDVDRAVVTPGAEKPLWLSTNAGALLAQFKGFGVAAANKLLISNIQRADAQTLQGVLTMVALGTIGYRLTALARGQKTHERPQDWIKEGINRSGLFGALEDVNMFLGKATRGTVDAYRLIGADKPLSRNANRTILSSLLGPTAGKIENITRVTGAIGAGEWKEADTHAVRRAIILQNVVGLNQAFDAVERGVNNAFGVEMRAR